MREERIRREKAEREERERERLAKEQEKKMREEREREEERREREERERREAKEKEEMERKERERQEREREDERRREREKEREEQEARDKQEAEMRLEMERKMREEVCKKENTSERRKGKTHQEKMVTAEKGESELLIRETPASAPKDTLNPVESPSAAVEEGLNAAKEDIEGLKTAKEELNIAKEALNADKEGLNVTKGKFTIMKRIKSALKLLGTAPKHSYPSHAPPGQPPQVNIEIEPPSDQKGSTSEYLCPQQSSAVGRSELEVLVERERSFSLPPSLASPTSSVHVTVEGSSAGVGVVSDGGEEEESHQLSLPNSPAPKSFSTPTLSTTHTPHILTHPPPPPPFFHSPPHLPSSSVDPQSATPTKRVEKSSLLSCTSSRSQSFLTASTMTRAGAARSSDQTGYHQASDGRIGTGRKGERREEERGRKGGNGREGEEEEEEEERELAREVKAMASLVKGREREELVAQLSRERMAQIASQEEMVAAARGKRELGSYRQELEHASAPLNSRAWVGVVEERRSLWIRNHTPWR